MTRPQISTKKPAVMVIEPVEPHDAHDADTVRVAIPMWSMVPGATTWVEDVRIAHVNAAELNTDLGKKARAATVAWLEGHKAARLRLHIWGREKYGRLLGDLEAQDGFLSEVVLSLEGSRPMLAVADRHRGAVWHPVDE